MLELNLNPYDAGRIAGILERSGIKLTDAKLGNFSRSPQFIKNHLNHVWTKIVKVPEVVAILDGRDRTDGMRGNFWLGHSHGRFLAPEQSQVLTELLVLLNQDQRSDSEIAAAAGKKPAQISHYRNQVKKQPTIQTVESLALALGWRLVLQPVTSQP